MYVEDTLCIFLLCTEFSTAMTTVKTILSFHDYFCAEANFEHLTWYL